MEGNKRAPFGTAIHFMLLLSPRCVCVYIYICVQNPNKSKDKGGRCGPKLMAMDRWAQSSG